MKSLAHRSIVATYWNFGANSIVVVVLFARSVLLARWLPVEVFGTYGFATAIAGLSAVVVEFGLNGALLHRAAETEDEGEAAATHFTLKLLLTGVWLLIMSAVALMLFEGPAQLALLVVSWTMGLWQLIHTPTVILRRRVVHRRLAAAQVASALVSSGIALALAWQGFGLWALLATDVAGLVITAVALYVWRPVWVPRLAWSGARVRYFFQFGLRNFTAITLKALLTKADDLWTGAFLGETALGYYSRAYRFATYPTSVIAAPVNSVVGGTYAELKYDRLTLSKAFFRTNALLVRIGFPVAGLLALVAPEFIRLLLGDKWMPMLDAFRVMLLFTMLDPIRVTVGELYVAVGRPEQLAWARAVQLLVLLAGLFVLGPSFGIVGVAAAVNLMAVVGIGLLLWQARSYVDIDVRRLFGVPAVAMLLGIAAGRAVLFWPAVLVSDWHSGAVKVVVFGAVYGTIVLLVEGAEVRKLLGALRMRLSGSA